MVLASERDEDTLSINRWTGRRPYIYIQVHRMETGPEAPLKTERIGDGRQRIFSSKTIPGLRGHTPSTTQGDLVAAMTANTVWHDEVDAVEGDDVAVLLA